MTQAGANTTFKYRLTPDRFQFEYQTMVVFFLGLALRLSQLSVNGLLTLAAWHG